MEEFSYMGHDVRVLYWGHMKKEESIVRIGKYCSIASNIRFYVDGNHRHDHASSFPFYELGYNKDMRNKNGWGRGAPVVGNDVWIGNDCIIMSGVEIADGCVVGTASVVTKSFPPYSIIAGNPAVFIKKRFDDSTIDRFMKTQWWNLPGPDVIKYLAPVQYNTHDFLSKAEELALFYADSFGPSDTT